MRLALELRGVACMDLERDIPDRKSIMASRSFGRPVTMLADMREAVAAYTARAAEKLRRQHLATAHLMVFVETNRFKPGDALHCAARPVHLPVATSDSGKLIGAALAGLKAIWRDGYRYKKAGVMLLDLHPAAAVQEGLFDKADNPRRNRADAHNRPAQLPLRPGYGVLCRSRLPTAVETAPGIAVALLHDGVG